MDCFVATLLARTTNTAFLYWLHFQSDSEEHRTAMRLEGWPRGSCLRLSRQSKSNLQHRKHQAASPRCLQLTFDAGALAMDQQLRAWKLALARFCSPASPAYPNPTRPVPHFPRTPAHYKRGRQGAPPGGGGSGGEFLKLAAAGDALMKER